MVSNHIYASENVHSVTRLGWYLSSVPSSQLFGGNEGKLPGAAKATHTPNTLLQLLHLNNFRIPDSLNDKLSDAISLLHLEVLLAVIEEKNLYLATVVGIDNTSPGIDEILGRKAGSRSNSAIFRLDWLDLTSYFTYSCRCNCN